MKPGQIGNTVLVVWLAISAGCATSTPGDKRVEGKGEFTPCEEPRPEICTMHYAPACGVLEDGGRKTYSNACTACSDHAVAGYNEGACAADGGR